MSRSKASLTSEQSLVLSLVKAAHNRGITSPLSLADRAPRCFSEGPQRTDRRRHHPHDGSSQDPRDAREGRFHKVVQEHSRESMERLG